MSKLIWIVILACIACRLLIGRWPWQPKALPRSFGEIEALTQARAILGVNEAAGRQDILDAHRRRLTLVHPDRGGSNDQVHEANAARDLLLKSLRQSAQG